MEFSMKFFLGAPEVFEAKTVDKNIRFFLGAPNVFEAKTVDKNNRLFSNLDGFGPNNYIRQLLFGNNWLSAKTFF